MPVPISALYLAVFAVFASVLAFFPGKIRGTTGVSVGDGGNIDLLVATRRHANFVEYVPYFMLMFVALELNGTSAAWLHGLGVAMLVSRALHAAGIKEAIQSPLRGAGAGGTLLVTLVATVLLVLQFLRA